VLPLIGIAGIEAALGLLTAGVGEVQGTYGSRDHFAGLLEMILPFAIAYGIALLKPDSSQGASRVGSVLKACAAFLAATLMLLALLYSASRMGVVSSLTGLFLMAASAVGSKRIPIWRRFVVIACTAAVVLLIITFFSPDELIARFGGLLTDKEARWPVWGDTLRLIRAFPLFGCGLGNYGTAFLKYQTTAVDLDYTFAHNDVLQLVSELGIGGFLILAALMLGIFGRAMRAVTSATDRNTRFLGLGCVGAISAISLHSLADFNMYIPANALILAWLSGIAAGSSGARSVAQKRGTFSPVLLRYFGRVISCLLLIYAAAWLAFGTAFASDRRSERLFCTFGICDTDAVVAAQTLEHGGTVAAVPETMLLEAIRRDPAAPQRWCDLGEAMLKSGNIAQARYCFSNAVALAPNIPPVLQRAAAFYWGIHDDEKALQEMAHILERTDSFDDVIFDWYVTQKIGVREILRDFPSGPRAAQAYLRYLINIDDASDAATVWNWILSRGNADDNLARDYTNFLFAEQKYQTSAESWARYLGNRRNGYLESNWLFNGGFETRLTGAPLDWKIEEVDGVVAMRDSTVAHRGSHSLRIQFAGSENVNYSQVTQTAFVTPGNYRFEAYVRTLGITTDQGVKFHIFDPEAIFRVDISTEQVLGTNGWKKIERSISIPKETRLIEVQVVRPSSWKLFDNKITGTAWIDSVSLSKLD